MTAKELKQKYLDFFVKNGHKKLPNLPLVPENDPSTLFISAGMQPLVPYLLGEPHLLGKRLVSLQRCLRTGDIDEVGDFSHLTFFEMLGNWSLGDYWKEESLSLSLEFLTKVLGLDEKRLHVTVFAGDKNASKDVESEEIWLSLGIPKKRVWALGREDNWWEAGAIGPGGPDSEIFYDLGKPACGSSCRPGDSCGRFFEMWNNVFIEYNRQPDGTYEKLAQKNVDTGMGVERTAVVLEGKNNVFATTTLWPLIQKIEEVSHKKYEKDNQKSMRVVADHLRAAAFLLADGVLPSNTEQGYVLRRLIRRAVRFGRILGIKPGFTTKLAEVVVQEFKVDYPHLAGNLPTILSGLENEEQKFSKALEKGLKEFEKLVPVIGETKRVISGDVAFRLYESYGFPLELIEEFAAEKGFMVDRIGFEKAKKGHQQKSRASLEKKFTGGLADHAEQTVKLHTTAHLLHAALREVLGPHVKQAGQNITAERLRFDFTHPSALTEEQLKKVEDLVNWKIKEDLPVKKEEMSLAAAKKKGATALFGEKYGEKVTVYAVGSKEGLTPPFSIEVCGGPHVSSTGEIGGVRIVKEKAIGAGRRRIYVTLE